jgi:hypothetical protein
MECRINRAELRFLLKAFQGNFRVTLTLGKDEIVSGYVRGFADENREILLISSTQAALGKNVIELSKIKSMETASSILYNNSNVTRFIIS